MSNPILPDFLTVENSQTSRLADVSDADTVDAGSTVNRSRTERRARSKRKKKIARTGSEAVMSRGEDELVPDWTVFGELFEGHHAPLVTKRSLPRGKRSASVSVIPEGGPSNLGRTTSSVLKHWQNIIAASRSSRSNIRDEERGEESTVAPSSSQLSRPIDITSTVSSSRLAPDLTGSPPFFTFSPQRQYADERISIIRDSATSSEGISQQQPTSPSQNLKPDPPTQTARPQQTSSSSDSSSDSEDDRSKPKTNSHKSRISTTLSSWRAKVYPLSTLQRNMLKCAFAYFISSLFTFVPFLSQFVSDISSFGKGGGFPSPAAHMIATISVYYNPAKTAGGMFEADIFCIIGVIFASFVTCGSIFANWLLNTHLGVELLGDIFIFVWVAMAMMVVCWTKVWINKASFNTAASMTSIIMFIVVVKEGGFITLGQILVSVAIGASIANVICFIIWPQSATVNLQRDMITSLESYATLLEMLTSSFLLDPRSQGRTQLIRAVEAHQASFTSLKRSLDEARSEWALDPPDAPRSKRSLHQQSLNHFYGDAVDSLNRLAQHLAGLRSGTKLQRDLTAKYGKRKMKKMMQKEATKSRGSQGQLPTVEEQEIESVSPEPNEGKVMDEETLALAAAAAVFGSLIDDVGPPMAALTDACTGTLKSMRKALIEERERTRKSMRWFHDHIDGVNDFPELGAKIERALYNFDSTSNQALMRLYRRSAITDTESIASTTDGMRDDIDTMFLVYFFIFTLQEFARELVSLVEIMGQLYEAQENALKYRGVLGWFRRVFQRPRSNTLNGHTSERIPTYGTVTNKSYTKGGIRPVLRKRFSNLVPLEPSHLPRSAFPKVRAHAPNTSQTPARSSLSRSGQIKQRLWSILHKLKDGDIRYSFKVGVSTAILASPAFIDATRPTFIEYRGEWALISFFVVMGQTIGATNFLAVHRICGTIGGAGVAVVAFVLFSPYPALLALFGFFFSLPCFYYIVGKPQYATTGRFVLLSYNLTALFCYNSRSKDVSVYTVALHRSISVITGVLWALIVSRTWWPSEARRELGVGLSDFLLNLGWLYNRLVMTYSVPPESLAQMAHEEHSVAVPVLGSTAALLGEHGGGSDERTGLLGAAITTGINTNIRHFMSMELHLQIKLIALQNLLSQAQNEPRLKGPFPVQLYRSILTNLQMILDLFHSMRCVTTREEWYTAVRRDFIVPVNKERREMVGNVILFFSVLSSAFTLKKPLPPYLPPAERCRQRLVDALKELTIVKERRVSSSRQLLYFAYALMMKGVIAELEVLGRTLQDAFGVIGQNVEEFEALFIDYTAADTSNTQ
ncbi:hypothetical protein CPB86DRAFT_706963 [Serendipita vermifera]|nr:hypothetical protein CPB86DRAFT_706963 [Serendipita vermifera]